jgi:hypothetical protein
MLVLQFVGSLAFSDLTSNQVVLETSLPIPGSAHLRCTATQKGGEGTGALGAGVFAGNGIQANIRQCDNDQRTLAR